MEKQSTRIAYAIGEFLLLTVMALIPPVLVYIDISVVGLGAGELAVTEFTQEGLLFMVALLFWYGAWQHPGSRGFLVLIAGFFSSMLMREMDALFDEISQGFWFWPAIVIAVSSIIYATAYSRNTVIKAMNAFVKTKPYYFILIGLIILLVFSRVFGSGSLIWQDLLGEAYSKAFRASLQEGLELLGYVYIAYGAFLAWFRKFNF